MHYTPFALPSMLAALVMFSLLIYVWTHRRYSIGARYFMGMMICCSIWAFGYGMSLMSVDLEHKIFWYNLAQIGPDFAPLFWLFLSLEHVGRSDVLQRKWIAALFTLPLITTLLMWTNDWHHLLRRAVILTPLNNNTAYLSTERGPWYIVETAYGYIIMAATLYLLFRFLKHSSSKKQTLVLIIGFLLPIFFNVLDVFKVNPLKPFGSTSILFSATGLILAWGLFRQRLLDIAPIARDKVLENISDGVIVLDDHNRIVDVNPAARTLFSSNYNLSSECIGKDIDKVLSECPGWKEQFAIAPDTRKVNIALQVKGKRRFFKVTLSPLFDRRGTFVGRVSILHDITEEKETNDRLRNQLDKIQSLQGQLRDQALRDPLTGCFNRRYLDEMLERASSRADRAEIMIGLVMLDIDHFKIVNDTYGHIIGDQVLQAIGHTLQQNVRLGDIVCRYGGEEFLIVFPGISLKSVAIRAQVLCQQIASIQVPAPSGDIINVTASMGVAMYPDHGESIFEVLDHVDQALYSAKHSGRNGVSVWEMPMAR